MTVAALSTICRRRLVTTSLVLVVIVAVVSQSGESSAASVAVTAVGVAGDGGVPQVFDGSATRTRKTMFDEGMTRWQRRQKRDAEVVDGDRSDDTAADDDDDDADGHNVIDLLEQQKTTGRSNPSLSTRTTDNIYHQGTQTLFNIIFKFTLILPRSDFTNA